MSNPNYFNDSPISSPKEDLFGIAPFAQALAKSFRKIKSPVGVTIALNGPWGSGKSSAVNLVRHFLKPDQKKGSVEVIEFKCWWFRGEEALTLAFLQELHNSLPKGSSDKIKELIPKIGKSLLQARPIIGPAVNLVTGGVWGAIAGGSADFAKQFFSETDSIESLFHELSGALTKLSKKFLIIIDDIDRLTPDEALLIFQLIKSVGRLPNVMYLVVFDRELAEKAVQRKYPSEGPHFLEKIIQASFELPLPAKDDLNSAVLSHVQGICGELPNEKALLRFMNVFYDAVSPHLVTPRDIARITNAITVSWPPVDGEVNVADFLALEVMRLFEPKLYNLVKKSSQKLSGVRRDYGNQEDPEVEIKKYLKTVPKSRREIARDSLTRLFPRLRNTSYGPGFLEEWEGDRRVCIEKHFDTYFKMSLGDETLSMSEIQKFIENCSKKTFVKHAFREALKSVRKSRKTKVPLLLDELNVHAPKIEKKKFEPLISALFEIADEIDREEDKERGFSIGNNQLRIHWLIRRLTFERCTLKERSDLFMGACKNAQLGWLVDFASSAIDDHYPREGNEVEPESNCLVEKSQVSQLKRHAVSRIEKAASNGNLIDHPQLPSILFRWRDFVGAKKSCVQSWCNNLLSDDVSLAKLAKAFTGESWSHGMGMFGPGDRVSMRHVQAAVGGIEEIMDKGMFRERIWSLAGSGRLKQPYQGYVDTLYEAWKKKESGEDD